jgi:glycosyltransferase involved in cell wall biosynthesis
MPTFGQGNFIEGAIRSVLLQGYPLLELFVMDGGSKDGTIEIIQKYAPWISGWVSEKDRGQSHAINKGLALATGHLFNWMNSDDLLLDGALATIGRAWKSADTDLLIGRCRFVDVPQRANVAILDRRPADGLADYLLSPDCRLPQPSTFCSTARVKEVGGVREDLHCIMDWDLYLRMTLQRNGRLHAVPVKEVLSEWTDYPETKTRSLAAQFRTEEIQVLRELEPTIGQADKRALRSRLKALEAEEAIRCIESKQARRISALATLALRRPAVIGNGHFWNALRRSL